MILFGLSRSSRSVGCLRTRGDRRTGVRIRHQNGFSHGRLKARLGAFLVFWMLACAVVRAAGVSAPADHLGFTPGADFRLASWSQVVEYFRNVDAASDRVVVRELGRTTEDRPYLVAFVGSPAAMAQLDHYRTLQQRIADPRMLAEEASRAQRVVDESKVVILITCSIHSSETASTLMAMELLHELATADDARTREVLDNAIVILVPSANPDGVDKVAGWYERSKGQPWEGGGMPWLYHKYAGHDTNRDWFMLNLRETQLLTKFLYKEWFPTITYDVHQMGSRGARLFVPPFYDPVNPNLDPRINQGIALIGTHMAADLARNQKKGVLTNAMYDNWWNGGNRTTPQRHNMVGVLTEAASVKMASPVFVEKDELRAATRGFSDHRPSVNFVDPWQGGWWRLRDIVEYELICARSLLTLAARYKDAFQANYLAMGREAIRKGQEEPPFGWVIPADQADLGRAEDMVGILRASGVEVRQARVPFESGGRRFPARSWIMSAAQPYRAHLKDMMERQVYPPRFTAKGAAEAPYDVAGWTLPLQMGVRVSQIDQKQDRLFRPIGQSGDTARSDDDLFPLSDLPRSDTREVVTIGSGGHSYRMARNLSNDDFRVLTALETAGGKTYLFASVAQGEGVPGSEGAMVFGTDDQSKAAIQQLPERLEAGLMELHAGEHLFALNDGRADGVPIRGRRDTAVVRAVRRARIGLYQPWVPSMDEGWTRLVLENYGFPYTTLHNAEIRAGDLSELIDVLILPSVDAKTLRDGYDEAATEPAYAGGLGQEGAAAVREFVAKGGTLVCLERSCLYAIETMKLGVTERLKSLPSSTFYCPGSLLHVRYAHERFAGEGPIPLTLGMPGEGAVYFDRSLAFETSNTPARVWATYAGASAASLLESGWLLGAEKIQETPALVEVPSRRGRVILFGFPPQHRGQTHATFRLLFNCLILPEDETSDSGNAAGIAGDGRAEG